MVETLNLEEDEEGTEKMIVILLRNGACQKEIKDWLDLISVKIAQSRDSGGGKRWKKTTISLLSQKKNKLIGDSYMAVLPMNRIGWIKRPLI